MRFLSALGRFGMTTLFFKEGIKSAGSARTPNPSLPNSRTVIPNDSEESFSLLNQIWFFVDFIKI
jgi:hypothetical protein